MLKNLLFCLILLLLSINLNAQSGVKFPELVKRLDPYFDSSLIEDVRLQLPQGSDFNIWGYDVGDYSGDGYNDLALTLRLSGDRSRKMYLYLFVDIDGFLTKVGQFTYEFLELPLEIGVVIRDDKAIVTKKNKQYDWTMDAFTFDNGALTKSEVFATRRIGDLTYEKVRNFVDLHGSDKYIKTKNGQEVFYRKYLMLPSYHRGRKVYKGYNAEVYSDYIDYVHEGAYYWKGDKDCSFRASSAYDDNYLYFSVEVTDDAVVPQYCDTCITDMIEVWLDINISDGENRFTEPAKDNKVKFVDNSETGIYKFSVNPGNYLEKEPTIKVASSDEVTDEQKNEYKNLKAISNLTEEGYIIKFRIPFSLLGFNPNPLNKDFIELGCSFVVIDYDNEFRPEEKTCISTSAFLPFDPSTYGSLILVPNNYWYGDSQNIYSDDIIKGLMEYGF